MTPLIDWTRAELRPAPRKSRFQHETFVPCVCPQCGHERWLRPFDARRMEQRLAAGSGGVCKACQRHNRAKRGYAAAVAKYPRFRWQQIDRTRAYRLAHPTRLENMVAAALDQIAPHYTREVALATRAKGRRQTIYICDFYVWRGSQPCIVEVHGRYAHASAEAQRRDRNKRALCKRRRIPLLELREEDIRAGRAADLLRAFFSRYAQEQEDLRC